MKKWLNVLLFVFICPMLMGGVVSQSAGSSYSSSVPAVQSTNTIPQEPNQSFSLSSQDFGLYGPVSFSGQYSKNYGYFLQGQLAQSLGISDAVALGLDLGQHQWRFSGTWGHVFSANQRFKLTMEHLSQDMSFDFMSGKTREWVGQNAYGLSYEYLLNRGLMHDININAFYSQADNKKLHHKLFMDGGVQYENLRRIAGATDKSASIGVDLLPLVNTLMMLQLNYDNVRYQTHYVANKKTSGLGATVSLHHLVTQHIKFQLLASDRKPYNQYQAEVDYLFHTAPGTRLEMGLVGSRLIGKHHLANDRGLGLNVNYAWGGDNSHPTQGYMIATQNSFANLAAWTAKPAVHMPQVLAIKDEMKRVVTTAGQSKKTMTANSGIPFPTDYKIHDVIIHEGEPFSQTYNDKPDNQLFTDPDYPDKREPMTLRVDGLTDSGLTVTYGYNDDHTIPWFKIEAKEGFKGKLGIYTVTITAHNKFGDSEKTKTFKIDLTHVGPSIDMLQAHHVVEKGAVYSHKLATISTDDVSRSIKTSDITITPTGSSEDLSYYGLSVKLDHEATSTQSATLMIETEQGSFVQHRTFDYTREYDIGIKGSHASAHFYLDSRGVPKMVDVNLGIVTVRHGGKLAVNISLTPEHFKKTRPASDTMSYEADPVRTTQGVYGKIEQDHLVSVTVPEQEGQYKLAIHAKNNQAADQGWSDDAIYFVDVKHGDANISVHTPLTVSKGDVEQDVVLADIRAGAQDITMQNITIKTSSATTVKPFADYGLTPTLSPATIHAGETGHLVLNGTVAQGAYDNQKTYQVVVFSGQPTELSGTFDLISHGPPQMIEDYLGHETILQGDTVQRAITWTDHFKNTYPDGVANMQYQQDEAGAGCVARDKITGDVGADGQLTIHVLDQTAAGEYDVCVHAKNTQYARDEWSRDAAYHVIVTPHVTTAYLQCPAVGTAIVDSSITNNDTNNEPYAFNFTPIDPHQQLPSSAVLYRFQAAQLNGKQLSCLYTLKFGAQQFEASFTATEVPKVEESSDTAKFANPNLQQFCNSQNPEDCKVAYEVYRYHRGRK